MRPQNGYNPAALIATIAGILPTMPGFLSNLGVLQGVPLAFTMLYDAAWFVGVAISTVVYCALMAGATVTKGSDGGQAMLKAA